MKRGRQIASSLMIIDNFSGFLKIKLEGNGSLKVKGCVRAHSAFFTPQKGHKSAKIMVKMSKIGVMASLKTF